MNPPHLMFASTYPNIDVFTMSLECFSLWPKYQSGNLFFCPFLPFFLVLWHANLNHFGKCMYCVFQLGHASTQHPSGLPMNVSLPSSQHNEANETNDQDEDSMNSSPHQFPILSNGLALINQAFLTVTSEAGHGQLELVILETKQSATTTRK